MLIPIEIAVTVVSALSGLGGVFTFRRLRRSGRRERRKPGHSPRRRNYPQSFAAASERRQKLGENVAAIKAQFEGIHEKVNRASLDFEAKQVELAEIEADLAQARAKPGWQSTYGKTLSEKQVKQARVALRGENKTSALLDNTISGITLEAKLDQLLGKDWQNYKPRTYETFCLWLHGYLDLSGESCFSMESSKVAHSSWPTSGVPTIRGTAPKPLQPTGCSTGKIFHGTRAWSCEKTQSKTPKSFCLWLEGFLSGEDNLPWGK